MPKLFRVHAAQQKIAHCEINIGYSSKNGGFGTVTAIITLQAMLPNQAKISR